MGGKCIMAIGGWWLLVFIHSPQTTSPFGMCKPLLPSRAGAYVHCLWIWSSEACFCFDQQNAEEMTFREIWAQALKISGSFCFLPFGTQLLRNGKAQAVTWRGPCGGNSGRSHARPTLTASSEFPATASASSQPSAWGRYSTELPQLTPHGTEISYLFRILPR